MDGGTVKAILFDFDNTLIETSRAGGIAIQKVSELLKSVLQVDDNTVSSICSKFRQKLLLESFDSSAGRTIDEVRVNHMEESIREMVDGSYPPSLASDCYFMWKRSRLQVISLTPDICCLLKDLRSRYKLLLLTNGESQTQKEKVKAVGCEEYFDAIVVGGDYPEQKPFPSIFTLCFDLLQVEAQDCVMVGDSLDTDIQGGFNAGLRATVWINSGEGHVPEGSAKPDFTIPHVLELPGILEKLR
ncbi:N-acylneuraminate-9-phosphatase [Synchiropus splendidus]|uniref:N-acylneuraminate-9-phosphatase n=1 Tax=Synchiropus splendidus TaxID=270530 RepID=UPI00237D5CB8|nr:N-acylneuraminate-9-phosphatase [Synchiropus splendidus]